MDSERCGGDPQPPACGAMLRRVSAFANPLFYDVIATQHGISPNDSHNAAGTYTPPTAAHIYTTRTTDERRGHEPPSLGAIQIGRLMKAMTGPC